MLIMECLNCGKIHNNKKFCSKSCSASFKNRNSVVSEETKRKISFSLKNKKEKEVNICLNCGEEHNNKKFCSYSCTATYNNKLREISDVTKSKLSKINKGKIGHKHTDETKKKLSVIRKTWLKENPDKHVWKYDSKFVSEPCEHLKKILKNENIDFIEEYTPLLDYNYSIDIVFPKYKVGIEVNGNQHYEKGSRKLTDYYKNRHNRIEENGWKLIEIHYTKVYNEEYIKKLFDMLGNLRV